MIWSRLKNMKCPKCNSMLGAITEDYMCVGIRKCSFKISEKQFNEIVKDLYTPTQFKSDMDKLSDWNNLGREKVTKGFKQPE